MTETRTVGNKIGFTNISYVAKPAGRPRNPNSERARKPWLSRGISKRTYYRRKAETAANAPAPPQQHSAHAAAWFATLGAIARLEYRAFTRRCLNAKRVEVGSILELSALGMV